MPEGLDIVLAPERLEDAPPEEQACFGRFTVESAAGPLTAGIDHYIGGYRAGPLVSGYHAAAWFAWNWWRLRYEPESQAPLWWRAHTLHAIGEGYAWPNITIFSDGELTTILSEPSARPDTKPFSYRGAPRTLISSAVFEAALDAFIGQMEGRLLERGLTNTNLSHIWAEIRAERADPAQATRRRLEALLARDPDEAPADELETLIEESRRFGSDAVTELAADQGNGGQKLTGSDLDRLADTAGASGRVQDGATLAPGTYLPPWGIGPAWRIGKQAADALRDQARLGEGRLDDTRLSQLAGVAGSVLAAPPGAPMAFTLERQNGSSATVLRAPNPAGRRFELARLVGDRIACPNGGPLQVATRAYTYRQKMQRSFAAELLCPFASLEAFLGGDLSAEAQQDAADHFDVSERTIETLLMNYGRLDRNLLNGSDRAA